MRKRRGCLYKKNLSEVIAPSRSTQILSTARGVSRTIKFPGFQSRDNFVPLPIAFHIVKPSFLYSPLWKAFITSCSFLGFPVCVIFSLHFSIPFSCESTLACLSSHSARFPSFKISFSPPFSLFWVLSFSLSVPRLFFFPCARFFFSYRSLVSNSVYIYIYIFLFTCIFPLYFPFFNVSFFPLCIFFVFSCIFPISLFSYFPIFVFFAVFRFTYLFSLSPVFFLFA